jgi:exodeoxyribonuclease-3
MILKSWNVNGFRAVLRKGCFHEWLAESHADVVCLQETKAARSQLDDADAEPDGFHAFWNSSTVKKGYSGVACLSRPEPLQVIHGLDREGLSGEGRLLTLEFEQFWLTNCYYPNSGMGADRLQFKLDYFDAWLEHAQQLRKSKPVVATGDFNVAHKEIDLKNPKRNQETPGFLPEERELLDRLVDEGFVDTFRMFETGGGHYTWWNMKYKARERNAGWRIDYFFVSEELRDAVKRAWIEPDVMGSDHCPVGLELDL